MLSRWGEEATLDEESVLYASDGRIATITLNRPENRNSMTADVMERFRACVARARADAELRCLVITGRGSSFCAGADFRGQGAAREGAALPAERAFAGYAAFLDVLDVEVPTVAAMNGHAIGGGLGLALVCDLRVASREARYGANFARLGFHSGMAISYLLPRLVGVPAAVDLLLSGRILSGAEAERIGLVHEAVAPEEVAGAARRRAEAVAANAPLAVRLMKQSLYRGLGWDPRGAARLEAFAQAATLATEDAREGIRALLEKREPRFAGR
jgi:enoyl-CoA hydratase/carnithine racemase